MNLLIIDDDPNARKTLGKILNAKGFAVEEAGTGAEAVRLCGAKFFNIVLIDVRLPDISGLEVLKAVRAINEDIIAIMMTGYASLDSSIEAMNKGAYSYITKPVNMDTALAVIEKGLEKQWLSLENKRLLKELQEANEDLKKAYEHLKEAQQKLIQSEKVAAVGRFSGWVAHEVKNPLGIMLGGLEFLEAKLANGDKDELTTITTIKAAVLRANSILESLLYYARPSELKTELVEAQKIVIPIIEMVKERASLIGITIDTDFSRDAKASVDKNQMEQAIINIVDNAIEAMPKGGKLSLKTYKAIVPELSDKNMSCVIEVDDTGAGILKENLARVIEPFFTTKERGIGTGLGLFIANKIIDGHNGKLLIGSEQGNGTSIRIALPLAN